MKRSLVCGTILLFIGLSITSSICGSYSENNNQYAITYYGTSPLGNSLKAYWNFDEGSGTTAQDSSGNGYDGAIHEATWTNGYSVYALDFNGVNAYVDIDTHAENLGFSKEDNYEITAYIQTETTTDGAVYCLSNTDSTLLYTDISVAANGSVIFRVGTVECTLTVVSSQGFNDGDWHFIEGKWYGSTTNPTMELYVDSELEATLTKWQCPFNANQFKKAKIGRRSADDPELNYFDGIIDEVKVYKSLAGNTEPEAPNITGETNGKSGTEYEYTFRAIDVDGDDVKYRISWGDGEQEWTDYNPEDTDVKVKHTYSERKTYIIIAYAQDINGADGDTAKLEVTMPKGKGSNFHFDLLEWFFNLYPHAFPILKELVGL